MKARADNLPFDPGAGMESAGRQGPRRTIRRIDVTMEREVIEIFHRPGAPRTDVAPRGPERQCGEGADAETCALCGQALPAGGPSLNPPSRSLPAETSSGGTITNETPKE